MEQHLYKFRVDSDVSVVCTVCTVMWVWCLCTVCTAASHVSVMSMYYVYCSQSCVMCVYCVYCSQSCECDVCVLCVLQPVMWVWCFLQQPHSSLLPPSETPLDNQSESALFVYTLNIFHNLFHTLPLLIHSCHVSFILCKIEPIIYIIHCNVCHPILYCRTVGTGRSIWRFWEQNILLTILFVLK